MDSTNLASVPGPDHEPTLEKLYREYTQQTDLPQLPCPNCGAQMEGFVCPTCKRAGAKNQAIGKRAAETTAFGLLNVIAWCMPIAIGVFGALIFRGTGAVLGFLLGLAAARVLVSDFARERLRGRASMLPEVELAQRYQGDVATHDHAAVCYLRWLRLGNASSPKGFADFLRNYRLNAHAQVDRRETLFNTILVLICARTNTDDFSWTKPLLDESLSGSEEQKRIVRAFFSAKKKASVHSIYVAQWETLFRSIEASHEQGLDLKRIDRRLPSATGLFQSVQNGVAVRDCLQPELLNVATSSSTFCIDVAEKLAKLPWRERTRVAERIVEYSALLAQNVATNLKPVGGRQWLGFAPALLFFVAVPAFFAISEGAKEGRIWEAALGGAAEVGLILGMLRIVQWNMRARSRSLALIEFMLGRKPSPNAV